MTLLDTTIDVRFGPVRVTVSLHTDEPELGSSTALGWRDPPCGGSLGYCGCGWPSELPQERGGWLAAGAGGLLEGYAVEDRVEAHRLQFGGRG